MRPVAFLLLLVLPMCIASFLPASPFSQGNKKRTAYKVVRYKQDQGACNSRIKSWSEWDTGLSFSVRVINNGASEITDWDVEVVFDRAVKSISVFNAQGTPSADLTSFKAKPLSYNGKVPKGAEVNFQAQLTFADKSVEPNVKSITINGDTIECSGGQGSAPEIQPIVVEEDDMVVQEAEKPVKPAPLPAPVKPVKPAPQPAPIKPVKPAPQPAPVKPVKPAPLPAPVNPGSNSDRGVFVKWPKKVMGLYILLADNDEEGFENTADGWTPELFPWQQEAANVLFFTFIHPETMDIPPSFKKLAATRGKNVPGAVPKDTVILFAIGGYAYSLKPNPWWWLESRQAAEEMADRVAKWPEQYGCDGIDLDLEEGAGARAAAGPNMVHFIRRLRQLQPKMIISQPTYGYPQVQAESDVINASWDANGKSANLADSIGLMVYEGKLALNYVKNFAAGASQWEGFPIKVNVPTNAILLGAKGSASAGDIVDMAKIAIEDDLLGIMVWYASVKNGFHYAVSWDASIVDGSIQGYKEAMKILKPHA